MKGINNHQKLLYSSFASSESEKHVMRFLPYLHDFETRDNIRILDIGGATGDFAYQLKKHFNNSTIEVYVVDTMSYDSWNEAELGKEIHFICDSAENLDKIFESHSFDLIFSNRVFHHFVQFSWCKSIAGIKQSMKTIQSLLKANGLFCIMDHFYNGAIVDWGSSLLVYMFTSIKIPCIVKLVKRIGAESAGIGTCFLSEMMWKKYLSQANFHIQHIEHMPDDKMTFPKRILMFKNASRDNLIIASPCPEK